MDIFVRNLPYHATGKQLENYFREPLATCGITVFYAEKMRDKPCGIITVLDAESAQRFLTLYGVPAGSPLSERASRPLLWNRRYIKCCKSDSDPSDFSIRALAYEESQRAAKATTSVNTHLQGSQNEAVTRFAIQRLKCGVWDYAGTQLAFMQHFEDDRPGSVSFGLNGAVILLGGSGSKQCRVDLNYYDCRNIVIGTYDDPTISFTLAFAPKFYEVSGEDFLANAIMRMTLGPRAAKSTRIKKTRLQSINDQHFNSQAVSTCFVYRILLSNHTVLSNVKSLLGRRSKTPPTLSIRTVTLAPRNSLASGFHALKEELESRLRLGLPFSLLYQVERLARNGILPPHKVRELLPKILEIYHQHNQDASLSALRHFYNSVPPAGPDTEASRLSRMALEQMLKESAVEYERYQYNPENPYQLVKRHKHINLIHKIIITPTSTRLEGLEPEPTNRVIRKFHDSVDSFVRVVFEDEDGGSVRYDPRASQEKIFHERFKRILDTDISIAGRHYSFLGFSHSSLRAQSC